MRPRLLVLGVAFSCLLVADENARQKVHVTTTQHLDFSPGGTLRLQNSTDELTVEGWERPEVEVSGDIDVKVRQGETTLGLAPEGPYDIDAKSALGTVDSDFPGVLYRRLWLFGHRFMDSMPAAPHKLQLRIGFGDILILKMAKAPTPAPLSSSHE